MEQAIINFMQKNEFLYNKKHTNYRNIDLRNQKFNELAKQLKMPKDKIKARWRTLKDKFVREIRLEKNKNLRNEIKMPRKKWKWMDSMMFLANVEHDVKNRTNGISHTTIAHDPPNDNISFDPDFEIKIESIDTESNAASSYCELNFETINDASCSPSQSSLRSDEYKSQNLLDSADQQMDQLINLAKSRYSTPRQKSTKNAVQLFFDCISQQVDEANISRRDFGKLQIEILQVVNEIIYKNEN